MSEVSNIRFDGECLSDALNANAKRLDLPLGGLIWQDPTGHWFTTEQRAWDDVRDMLVGWIWVLEREIQSRKQLPPGWEPNGDRWPESPIRDVEHLREWLDSWNRRMANARATTSEWSSRPESYLEDIRRELRNTRRAFREWGVLLPVGFNDNPADIFEAEKHVVGLIDGLGLPPGKPIARQPDELSSSNGSGITSTDLPPSRVIDALKLLDDGRKRSILVAMHELKATRDGVLVSAARIAREAIDSRSGADAIKNEMVTLKGMGLVDSKVGRGNGSKLTDLGSEVASELKKRGNGSTN